MTISDQTKTSTCLERIGYYRLSGYWYPFREIEIETDPTTGQINQKVLDTFKPGTEFRLVYELYVFDKKLRMIMLDAIERVEIGMRVDVALLLGSRNPLAHRDPNQLHRRFVQYDHVDWLRKLDEATAAAREEFVKSFNAKYSSPLPIWMAVELWDFGMLSRFVGGMLDVDSSKLAQAYGLPKRDQLKSWLRSINTVRNICAHHGRLWNRSLAAPGLPHYGAVPLLDHLIQKPAQPTPEPLANSLSPTRIYAVAAAMQFLLRKINPSTSWARRLKEHMKTFPSAPSIGIEHAGFPPNWESLPLWR
ncbi:Abi family protein [Roseomonas stagni]|uniref:Abi family protein n=1 Tax=Falsiroseomonas algicola TaxID=2716930 RepID=A0A6M1LV21_9PROT|nr:Abi family protein [Falsiroseomonas algicola]NGM24301.1 Abi family protein [Falsiroseomonas algicola]